VAQDAWSSVDAYLADRLAREDGALIAAREAADAAGLVPIQVSPLQGKMLQALARAAGARRALELGTLAGYSAIWIARALPDDGRLVTIEVDPVAAQAARANLKRAGLQGRVEVRLGRALEVLPTLRGGPPFDFVFIDADKERYAEYLEWAIELGRPGTLIVADNVVRGGEVANAASRDPRVAGVRAFIEKLASDPRVVASAAQTVGAKGWDGFAVAVVK
jgi:predicted O-methyltransferase YrrM